MDEFLIDGFAANDVDRWVRGACLVCPNGCGLEVAVKDGRMVGVRGRAEDRINHGRLGAGRPCDYSGLTYVQLRERGGIQGPMTADAPEGTERLYADGRFHTEPADCETYGHYLLTGTPVTETEFRARQPNGRAVLKAAPYEPAYELPDADYALRLTTDRTVYHWHTCTKTKRAAQLQEAAPTMWVELSEPDATRLGITEGDIVCVTSRRGSIEAPARISGVREGVVFAPWYYGSNADTAANELTLTAWDPVSKQPEFKVPAVTVERIRVGDGPAPAPMLTASAPVSSTAATPRPRR